MIKLPTPASKKRQSPGTKLLHFSSLPVTSWIVASFSVTTLTASLCLLGLCSGRSPMLLSPLLFPCAVTWPAFLSSCAPSFSHSLLLHTLERLIRSQHLSILRMNTRSGSYSYTLPERRSPKSPSMTPNNLFRSSPA